MAAGKDLRGGALAHGQHPDRLAAFERQVLPHLPAAHNLARWLVRNDQDAEDVMQEAMLRAFRFFDGFSGSNPRAWLLAVVRNCCYGLLEKQRQGQPGVPLDEELHAGPDASGRTPETPEGLLLRNGAGRFLSQAVEALRVEYREVFVLRELEGLSYKEIAELARIPLGTVMSRLSRARRDLQAAFARHDQGGSAP